VHRIVNDSAGSVHLAALAPTHDNGNIGAHLAPASASDGPANIIAAARRLEAEGRDIVRLDIGEPHLGTPAHIVDAAVRALRAGATRYVAPAGLPALRDAIASDARARGIDVTAEQVVVTSGAKPMLLYALLALARRGDDVLVPDPGYPGYASAAHLAGARAVPYPVVPRDGRFAIDVDRLRDAITSSTRVLVLNAPQNPTGGIMNDEELVAIAELARAHDLQIVSDEVYARLSFGESRPRSIAELPGMGERTIVVDSFSKTYAMTGWRLGYGLLPAALVGSVTTLVADSTTCAPAFVQQAGLAALLGTQDSVEDARAEYRQHRDVMLAAVNTLDGVRASSPAGGFYLFADVRELLERARIHSAAALADVLLHEYGVACIPGSAYGARGAGHLRLSFASPRERLDEACRRLARCVSEIASGEQRLRA
jgi:aspartate/methionine/tyrosine aminotransferase